ncbi:hypothetical protein [Marivita geojedonensis]|uniref:Sulfotransferase domain-containing protein n=1 Tax=Marivita geojedonensis TaxID=1123756 RepID=A0A1X4NCS2_9RHOB|nr:hypothetical protein [Marivita geojedonensis]OSQ44554.1 hypothetical protein MGEO_18870 [Marivita geojedonensis]PRY73332.1 hypothetical protein CLV76_13042 [Marivita geojedonensis]
MQVVLHTGLHQTDSDRLFKTLLRNRDGLRPEGVAIPGPGKYRRLISEMLNALGDDAAAPDARDVLLDSILDEDTGHVDRLILSHENLFSVPKIAFQGGAVYRKAEQRLRALREIFEDDRLEVFLALRNPATFLPALLEATPHDDMAQLLHGLDPAQIRWSDLIARIIEALPGVPVTVWCDEDSPLIWGELIREFAGVEPTHPVIGAYSRMAEITSQEGMERFRSFLAEKPYLNEIQIRRVMVAFLEKYADEEKLVDEFDLPGWDQDLIADLTEQYEEDLYDLGRMPSVTLITP